MNVLGFVMVNAIAIALLWTARVAPSPQAVYEVGVAASLLTRWLPFALACATGLTAALAIGTSDPVSLFRRHAALYLAVPASMALVRFGALSPEPLVAAPLLLVVAGIVANGFGALWATRDVRGDRSLGLLLGLTVLAASLALLPYDRTVQLPRSDEPHYLLVMQSLVVDRDLDLTNDYDGDYPDYYGERLPDRHVIQVGQTQRPIHDLGLPIIGALPFAIARRTGVLVFMCVVGALFAWRGYALLRALKFSPANAFLAASSVALLHPIFTYTTQIYPELPAALVTLVVAEVLVRPLTPRRAAVASALCGILAWLTIRAIFAAVPMGIAIVLLALRRRDPRLVVAAALPGILVVAAYALLEGLLTGVFLPGAGYVAIREQQTVVTYAPWIGLPGLLFDRTFGLLSHVPLYALAAFDAIPLWRRGRALGSAALAVLALGWLVSFVYLADIRYWWADGSPAARYLVSTLPLLLCAIAAGIERLRSVAATALALAAAGWSVMVTFVFALIPAVRYDVANEIAASGEPGLLWQQLAAVLRANVALLFPSMVRAAPQDFILAAAWLFFVGMLVLSGARRPAAPTVSA